MSTPLRLVHLIDLAKVGGVESMFADFIQAAAPNGLQVEHHVVVDEPNLAPRFVPVLERHAVSVASPKTIAGIRLPRRPAALRAARRVHLIRRARPDVVIAWNQFTEFNKKPLDLGAPLVYYEHGMSWYEHSPALIEGFLPHVCMGIGASSAGVRMLQLKHQVAFPVVCCRNPLRPTFSVEAQSRNGLVAAGKVTLGVASRLVPLKAIGIAILALKHLSAVGVDATLSIAGDGPERSQLEQLVASHQLADKVRFLGLVDDMPGFYRSIDVLLNPAMHETLGLSCVEAMAFGVPVVATCVDGLPEVVADGRSGRLVRPSLSIAQYQELTGSSCAFARTVYDPADDRLHETLLLDPALLAEAILDVTHASASYRNFSRDALSAARDYAQYPEYLAALYRCLMDSRKLFESGAS